MAIGRSGEGGGGGIDAGVSGGGRHHGGGTAAAGANGGGGGHRPGSEAKGKRGNGDGDRLDGDVELDVPETAMARIYQEGRRLVRSGRYCHLMERQRRRTIRIMRSGKEDGDIEDDDSGDMTSGKSGDAPNPPKGVGLSGGGEKTVSSSPGRGSSKAQDSKNDDDDDSLDDDFANLVKEDEEREAIQRSDVDLSLPFSVWRCLFRPEAAADPNVSQGYGTTRISLLDYRAPSLSSPSILSASASASHSSSSSSSSASSLLNDDFGTPGDDIDFDDMDIDTLEGILPVMPRIRLSLTTTLPLYVSRVLNVGKQKYGAEFPAVPGEPYSTSINSPSDAGDLAAAEFDLLDDPQTAASNPAEADEGGLNGCIFEDKDRLWNERIEIQLHRLLTSTVVLELLDFDETEGLVGFDDVLGAVHIPIQLLEPGRAYVMEALFPPHLDLDEFSGDPAKPPPRGLLRCLASFRDVRYGAGDACPTDAFSLKGSASHGPCGEDRCLITGRDPVRWLQEPSMEKQGFSFRSPADGKLYLVGSASSPLSSSSLSLSPSLLPTLLSEDWAAVKLLNAQLNYNIDERRNEVKVEAHRVRFVIGVVMASRSTRVDFHGRDGDIMGVSSFLNLMNTLSSPFVSVIPNEVFSLALSRASIFPIERSLPPMNFMVLWEDFKKLKSCILDFFWLLFLRTVFLIPSWSENPLLSFSSLMLFWFGWYYHSFRLPIIFFFFGFLILHLTEESLPDTYNTIYRMKEKFRLDGEENEIENDRLRRERLRSIVDGPAVRASDGSMGSSGSPGRSAVGERKSILRITSTSLKGANDGSGGGFNNDAFGGPGSGLPSSGWSPSSHSTVGDPSSGLPSSGGGLSSSDAVGGSGSGLPPSGGGHSGKTVGGSGSGLHSSSGSPAADYGGVHYDGTGRGGGKANSAGASFDEDARSDKGELSCIESISDLRKVAAGDKSTHSARDSPDTAPSGRGGVTQDAVRGAKSPSSSLEPIDGDTTRGRPPKRDMQEARQSSRLSFADEGVARAGAGGSSRDDAHGGQRSPSEAHQHGTLGMGTSRAASSSHLPLQRRLTRRMTLKQLQQSEGSMEDSLLKSILSSAVPLPVQMHLRLLHYWILSTLSGFERWHSRLRRHRLQACATCWVVALLMLRFPGVTSNILSYFFLILGTYVITYRLEAFVTVWFRLLRAFFLYWRVIFRIRRQPRFLALGGISATGAALLRPKKDR